MKLGYYFYYFQKLGDKHAPRILHDLRPTLDAYEKEAPTSWKTSIRGNDDESVFLVRTNNPEVWMIGGTRDKDIIKAVNRGSLKCEDIHERLEKGETTGFVGYFTLNDRTLGLVSTTRGPRTAALSRLINAIIQKLRLPEWRFHIGTLGTCITVEEARTLAFMSQTTLTVSEQNPLFRKFVKMIGCDANDVRALTIKLQGKPKRDIGSVVGQTLSTTGTDGLDRMSIRARASLDDDLTDFHLMTDGRLSEDIDSQNELTIISQVRSKFNGNPEALNALRRAHQNNTCQSTEIPALVQLSDVLYWRRVLAG